MTDVGAQALPAPCADSVALDNEGPTNPREGSAKTKNAWSGAELALSLPLPLPAETAEGSAAATDAQADAGAAAAKVIAGTADDGTNGSAVTFGKVVWTWKHRTGWRPYTPRTSNSIEDSYNRGEPKVLFQSGKGKVVPMEIFFEEMVQYDPKTDSQRDVWRNGPDTLRLKCRRFMMSWWRHIETGRPRKVLCAEYQDRRASLKKKGDQIATPHYDVAQYYWPSGVCQYVARSGPFFLSTMFVVVLNSAWIAVDADFNTAATLYEAEYHFQVMENLFCAFFTAELLVRYGAFKRKRDCFKDKWFRFDFCLVTLMVLETWGVPLVLVIFGLDQDGVNLGEFTVLRIARLCRLTRMARLLRAVPEVLTLLKGISAATRSVFFTLLLLILLLFVFGIIFRTQAEGYEYVRDRHFASVGNSMWTLLMTGTFLDGPTNVLNDIVVHCGTAGYPMMALFMCFIFFSSFTVLNMLIGILCEVVSQVSQNEKNAGEVEFLRTNLLEILEIYDKDDDKQIGPEEFDMIMMNPEFHEHLSHFGTDVNGLRQIKDALFDAKEDMDADPSATRKMRKEESSAMLKERSISFEDFLQVCLRLRGGHNAHVTDIVELREFIRRRVERLERGFVETIEDAFDGSSGVQRRASGMLASAQSRCSAAVNGAAGLSQAAASAADGDSSLRAAADELVLPQDPDAHPAPWEAVLQRLDQMSAAQRTMRQDLQDLRGEVAHMGQVVAAVRRPGPPGTPPALPSPSALERPWSTPTVS